MEKTHARVVLTYKAMQGLAEHDRKLHDILFCAGFDMKKPFNRFDHEDDRQVEFSQEYEKE